MYNSYYWQKALDEAEARLKRETKVKGGNPHPLALKAGQNSIDYCQRQLDSALLLEKTITDAQEGL